MNIIKHLRLWFYRKHYVLLDGIGASVTLSPHLFRYVQTRHVNLVVFMFRAVDTGNYCFAFVDDFADAKNAKTYCSMLQHNKAYNCIGFHQDTPSVTAILSHYNMDPTSKVKLSVLPRKLPTGERFYEIQPQQNVI